MKRYKTGDKGGEYMNITDMEPPIEIKCFVDEDECALCLIHEELCDKIDISQRDQIKEIHEKFLSKKMSFYSHQKI